MAHQAVQALQRCDRWRGASGGLIDRVDRVDLVGVVSLRGFVIHAFGLQHGRGSERLPLCIDQLPAQRSGLRIGPARRHLGGGAQRRVDRVQIDRHRGADLQRTVAGAPAVIDRGAEGQVLGARVTGRDNPLGARKKHQAGSEGACQRGELLVQLRPLLCQRRLRPCSDGCAIEDATAIVGGHEAAQGVGGGIARGGVERVGARGAASGIGAGRKSDPDLEAGASPVLRSGDCLGNQHRDGGRTAQRLGCGAVAAGDAAAGRRRRDPCRHQRGNSTPDARFAQRLLLGCGTCRAAKVSDRRPKSMRADRALLTETNH